MNTPQVKTPWNPERLDVRSFAQASGQISAEAPLTRFARLVDELFESSRAEAPAQVQWRAGGSMRTDSQGGAAPAVWLHLQAKAAVPLQCQRCLGSVETALEVDRWFRFVADEATAEAQDDESEEDVLVLEPVMSLLDLLEDELLMSLPIVPMHETCPVPVVMQASDPGSALEEGGNGAEHPFAALARLKK
ncbi:MAG TPA: DUF177 domain-containing protein [Hydrogenophaga sp.]|nr:DUF177 domain-containing protein [Hydrogenophaga sp.]